MLGGIELKESICTKNMKKGFIDTDILLAIIIPVTVLQQNTGEC